MLESVLTSAFLTLATFLKLDPTLPDLNAFVQFRRVSTISIDLPHHMKLTTRTDDVQMDSPESHFKSDSFNIAMLPVKSDGNCIAAGEDHDLRDDYPEHELHLPYTTTPDFKSAVSRDEWQHITYPIQTHELETRLVQELKYQIVSVDIA